MVECAWEGLTMTMLLLGEGWEGWQFEVEEPDDGSVGCGSGV